MPETDDDGADGATHPSGRPDLFVLGTGQDDNVGDVVLRRELFDRLRPLGRLHVYLGPASTDFRLALDLQPSDVVYASIRTWHDAAWRTLRRNRVWSIDKPGELMATRGTLGRDLRLLPLTVAVRLRGGQVLRLGIGLSTVEPAPLRCLRWIFRLATEVRWRDTASPTTFGLGDVAPDWAFAWAKTPDAVLDRERRAIVVTYRGDRPPPSDALLDAVRTVADASSRPVLVLDQARRDAAGNARLASRLDAERVPWPGDRGLAEQEAVVRSLYRDAALVISDRLHALIMGMTEGAAPLCLTDRGEAKVGRHLDAVGFDRSSVRVADTAPAALVDVITAQIARRPEAVAATRAGHAQLDQLIADLRHRATGRHATGHRR